VSVYTDTIREQVLTPEAVANVQRAVELLRAAEPVVREALDLLVPIEWAMEDVSLAIYNAGGNVSDEEGESVRAGVYREAVDLAFDILNTAQRISQRA
jgi:hypothetical protein